MAHVHAFGLAAPEAVSKSLPGSFLNRHLLLNILGWNYPFGRNLMLCHGQRWFNLPSRRPRPPPSKISCDYTPLVTVRCWIQIACHTGLHSLSTGPSEFTFSADIIEISSARDMNTSTPRISLELFSKMQTDTYSVNHGRTALLLVDPRSSHGPRGHFESAGWSQIPGRWVFDFVGPKFPFQIVRGVETFSHS